MAGLHIVFPNDFRYGWDLRTKAHRTLLDDTFVLLKPSAEFYAPRCSPWSQPQNNTRPEKLQKAREIERPTLHWIAQRGRKVLQDGRAILVENPRKSTIFKISPLTAFSDGATLEHFDQCQYGAKDPETGVPVKKSTTLAFKGMRLRHMSHCCTGDDRCKGHAQLQGSLPGTSINRTAAAAVYPWPLVAAIVQDVIENVMVKDTC